MQHNRSFVCIIFSITSTGIWYDKNSKRKYRDRTYVRPLSVIHSSVQFSSVQSSSMSRTSSDDAAPCAWDFALFWSSLWPFSTMDVTSSRRACEPSYKRTRAGFALPSAERRYTLTDVSWRPMPRLSSSSVIWWEQEQTHFLFFIERGLIIRVYVRFCYFNFLCVFC